VTAAALLKTLRARGVTLESHGDRLKVRPVSAVTPDEIEALRQNRTQVLRLLAENAFPKTSFPSSPTSPAPDPAPPDHPRGDVGGEVPAGNLVPLSDGPQQPLPDLDSRTLCEHFGLKIPPYATTETVNGILADAMLDGRLDPKVVTDVHEAVVTAVRQLEHEIAEGRVAATNMCPRSSSSRLALPR
jgi:hypothetical protein